MRESGRKNRRQPGEGGEKKKQNCYLDFKLH